MEGIIGVMIFSLVFSGLYSLFKKAKTRTHAKGKVGIMIFLEVVLVFAFFGSFSMYSIPVLMITVMCMVVFFGILLGRKIYKTYLDIEENNFPDDDKK